MVVFTPPRGRHDESGHLAKPPFAQWADPKRICSSMLWRQQSRTGEIILGFLEGVPIAPIDNRHLVTIAGSRAGKTQTLLLPNLRSYDGPVLAIDPKGELASNSAKLRDGRLGQAIHVLDPFDETSAECSQFRASYNPLLDIKGLDEADIPDEVAGLCEALIIEDGNQNSYWVMAARNLLRGLILYELATETSPTLNRVRAILTSGKELDAHLKLMSAHHGYFELIKRAAATYQAKEEREASSVLASAIEQTAFLDSPRLQAVLEKSDFSLRDIKANPKSIYLVLPAAKMGVQARWLRMFITLAFSYLEREQAKPPAPVLIVLEEFATLGYLRPIETAAGFIAGADVKLWTVLQDLSQLKAHYPKSWETFIGNCGILTAFGNSDATTLNYLSQRLGETSYPIVEQVPVGHQAMSHGDTGERVRTHTSRLITSSELAISLGRNTNRCLVHLSEAFPFVLDRLPIGHGKQADNPRAEYHKDGT